MQTLGFLIDQLTVVNLKMWWKQGQLLPFRDMSLEDFKSKMSDDAFVKMLHDVLTSAADLDVQRGKITKEIDDFAGKFDNDISNDSVDVNALTQRKHKTYSIEDDKDLVKG